MIWRRESWGQDSPDAIRVRARTPPDAARGPLRERARARTDPEPTTPRPSGHAARVIDADRRPRKTLLLLSRWRSFPFPDPGENPARAPASARASSSCATLFLLALLALPIATVLAEGDHDEEDPLEHIMETYDEDEGHTLDSEELHEMFEAIHNRLSGKEASPPTSARGTRAPRRPRRPRRRRRRRSRG